MPCAVEAVAGRAYWTRVAGEEDLHVVTLLGGRARHEQRERAAGRVLGAGRQVDQELRHHSLIPGCTPPQVRLRHLKPLKQVDQLLTLLAINSGAQLGLIVDGDLPSLLEHGAPLPREEAARARAGRPDRAAAPGAPSPRAGPRAPPSGSAEFPAARRAPAATGRRTASTKRMRRKSRGPMPSGSSASVNRLDEKNPSCEIRKPTLRGARSASGSSMRSSSSSS